MRDLNDPFDSTSEYVFVVKPKLDQPSLTIDGVGHSDYDGFRPLLSGKENLRMLKWRKKLFNQVWAGIESDVENIIAHINEQDIQEVKGFVEKAYNTNDIDHPGFVSLPFQELPTAVLFAGTNVSDHDQLFGLLFDHLCDNETSATSNRVALLQSKHCSTLKGMLKSFIQQVQNPAYLNQDGSYSNCRRAESTKGSAKPLPHDMQILEGWYEQQGINGKDTKLVAIVQDFEGFLPSVVEDFVNICSQYCQKIPIVLIVGLATSYGTLSQTLSNGALSKISVEKFNIHRSNELINGIISKVIVPCSGGFSLGYESYRHLMDQFLLYNFSVKSFLSHLKYAIMHHFYANPLSILHMLYDGNKRSLIHPKELKLSQDHIELIRMLPSVRRYIEDTYKDDKEAMKLAIVDDKYFVEVIIQRMMESLTEYREKYRAGLKIIQCLQDLMEPSQRKAIRTLHLYGLNDDFEQCVYWETVANTIKRLNRKKMVGFMEAVVNETRSLLMGFGPLDERIKKLKKISDALALASDPEQSSYKDALKQALGDTTGTESPSNTPSLRVRTRRAMSVNPFLLSNEEKNPEVISLLEVGSTVILDILRNLLRCYTEAPLYEAFYYQSQKLLSMTFNAQPRASVQVALHHPNYYLGCECCAPDTKAIKQEEPLKFGSKIFGDSGGANEDGAVLPTNPDTAIAYRLHQECGRMVNLYDWYMAFASIVERESKVKDEKSLDPQYQKQIQARFIHAVDELQYMGFIKPTQRKTDHVMRLTWGVQ